MLRDARLQGFAVASLSELYDRAYIRRLSAGAPDHEIDPYSEDERDRITEAFKTKRSRFFPFVFFQFWTGARTSEGVALRWGSVDLERRAAKRLDEPPDETAPANLVHAPYWTDPGRKVLDDKRTSLIIDPADGRIPPLTSDAQLRLARRRASGREVGRADGPEDRSALERCITWGLPTATLPGLYNNNIQIVQAPNYVAIIHEMVHETRIVPLDGRAPLASDIHQWFGSSRGHWDGATLVVETANFSDKTNFRGSGAGLHLVERFTRVDAVTIGYQLTVDDPTTWARSWH
jgi:hypothetical protein